MKTIGAVVCMALLGLVPTAAAQQDAQRSMPLAGVSLSLKEPQGAVLKQLGARAQVEKGEHGEWLIYSPEKRDVRSWLGAVVFKRGKLVFAARSWGSPGNHPVKAFMREFGPGVSGCRFALVQTLDRRSPVRVTTIRCGRRELIFQVAKDERMGLYECEIETLGSAKGQLARVGFWKPCHGVARWCRELRVPCKSRHSSGAEAPCYRGF